MLRRGNPYGMHSHPGAWEREENAALPYNNRRTANRADTQVCPYPPNLLMRNIPVGADLCVRPSVWVRLYNFFVAPPANDYLRPAPMGKMITISAPPSG